ncbi:hypothetical protein A3K73_04930 [Candidatus Pacearchaeota archaeon RBG_13_36_9]|nr:MAG: hypothetical protein A3K73_04930 [Candidatus Pacearchaeota archaeon RBG_13_36_9]
MPKAKPIQIEAYKCPKCGVLIEGDYETAQKHVDIPVDKPLPVGLVYSGNKQVCIIRSKGNISREPSINPKIAHVYLQLVTEYFPESDYYAGNHINSRTKREDFRTARATFLSPNMFKAIKKRFRGYIDLQTDKPLRFKRTDKALEKLASSGC